MSGSVTPSLDADLPGGYRWAKKVLPIVTEIAIFGGSITFSVVVQSHEGATHFKNQLSLFLALAYLFFVLTLGIATGAQMAFSLNETYLLDEFRESEGLPKLAKSKRKAVVLERMARRVFISAKIADLLVLTTLVAFTFLSLSVAAYEYRVGIASTVCTGVFVLISASCWIFQNCISTTVREKRDTGGQEGATPNDGTSTPLVQSSDQE